MGDLYKVKDATHSSVTLADPESRLPATCLPCCAARKQATHRQA